MELHASHLRALHDGGKRLAVFCDGRRVAGDRCNIAVREVHLRLVGNAVKNRRLALQRESIPADVRDLDLAVVRLAPWRVASADRRSLGGGGQADVEEAVTATAGLEMGLMTLSTLVAVGGIGLAFFFFLKNTRAADDMANRFAGLHRALVNKYYVDEIYDATLVQPIHIVSEEGLWKGIDVRAIDGAVNGVGEMVVGSSEILRRLQTGSVRVSAASLFLGVVLILGYFLSR
jgi:hypothetical protein